MAALVYTAQMNPEMFPVLIAIVAIIITIIMKTPSWVKGGIFTLMVIVLTLDSLFDGIRAFLR